MRTRRSRFTALVAIVFTACALTVAAAGPAHAITVTNTKLVDLQAAGPHVDMDGTRIVYHDERGGKVDVFMYDTATGIERAITTDFLDQRNPAIDGDKIVYAGDQGPGGAWAIYVYDLATSAESKLTFGTNDCYGPAIDNGVVVYVENTGPASYAIRRQVIGGAIDTIGTFDASSNRRPQNLQIDGSLVAYELADTTYDGDDEEPRTDVCLWKAGTVKTFEKSSRPRLAAGRLAYTSRDTRASYLYTTSTKTTKKLAKDSVGIALSSTNFVGWDRITKAVFIKNIASGGRATLLPNMSDWWAWESSGATSGKKFAYASLDALGSDLYAATFDGNVVGVSTSGAAYRGRATVKGMASTVAGKAVTGKVRLYRSSNGTTWTRIATHYATKAGKFSFKTGIVRKPTYFRVRYLGTSTKPAATSETLYVKPRVLLARPYLASTVSMSKQQTITGRVTPRIADVSKARLVYQFKPKGGSWHTQYMDGPVLSWTKHSGYWTYKERFVRFDTKGAWRIRMERPESDTWAESTSKWRYVTVK